MRQITITPGLARPSVAAIALIRDEPLRILMGGEALAPYSFTLSQTEGGAPLVEIPAMAGIMDLEPAAMQALGEGSTYFYNIWSGAASARFLCAKGMLTVVPSIVPTGAHFDTIMLNNFGQQGGVQKVVLLTRAQYEALSPPDPDVLYFMRELA
ncbi:phage upper tail fiber protein [Falsigemmobacter faecalis]|uniref:Minor tail protein gp31 C-terminal domain-containing protein n=1 Tax=Falsigemmobacter faecalis TaxID=2488730 RepID=A0A3P3DCC1_9RHOB|nr:hypothetical protein [Falsigemmobacter faecalis]RRH70048.1 hypothetical protein EG244_17720 [Falsigemmobacter faecalis]